jgi:aconitase A
LSRLDTANEVAYFQAGGILQFVLATLSGSKSLE